tara:strand:+ start:154 stop:393 length:240 start_codon:yes stop_codon:yes gene_type:complete
MLLDIIKIKMFEGPVTALMKKDRNGQYFALGHPKSPISLLFPVGNQFLLEGGLKNFAKFIYGTENFSNFILGNHKRKVG